MFGSNNNRGKVVVATLALAAAYPALTLAAEETPAADVATADDASPSAADASSGKSASSSSDSMSEIVVSAQKLNEARAGIETQTGASTYKIGRASCRERV